MKRRLVVLMACVMLSVVAFAQKAEKCPVGNKVNCTGDCKNFTDANKDGFCDFSKVDATKKCDKKDCKKEM
ncbi:MAG: hypothetical protein HUK18_00990, partial [Bacteroidales bacterium]|nr:hypothetical protein [Bacteroidales bacterium]